MSSHELQIPNQSRQIDRCLICTGRKRVEPSVQPFRTDHPNCGAFAAFAGYVLRGKVAALETSNQIEEQIHEE